MTSTVKGPYHAFVMSNSRKKEIFVLILCLLIGFALRFYTFDEKSLWIDEIHTFNDSREGLTGQLKYFNEKPADLLHPPLFYILTHFFYPFDRPERDLRIIPLLFGVLSVPIIYYLSRLFSHHIALPCALSLAFMAYHISISQDGRFYSLLMFLGMLGVFCFMKHLVTLKRRYLFPAALFYGIMFYTSYTSIPFIMFSQILWLYQIKEPNKKPHISSVLILNALTLLLCIPWVLFMALNYKGQSNFPEAEIGSLWTILSNILNDWAPLAPLTIISVLLLALFPIFSKKKKNAFLLLGTLLSPVLSLYFFCKLTEFQHYLNAKYLINFLPLFLIVIYFSLDTIEAKFERLREYFSLRYLFLILFIGSNMTMLPLYYRAEKQDFRGLVYYLGTQLQDGDKIFVMSNAYIAGILHYFSIYPIARHYDIPLQWKDSERKQFETKISLVSQSKKFTLYFSNLCLSEYVSDGGRLWIVAGAPAVGTIETNFPCVLKAYFDGSFSNFRKFPSDASMYLFLWDPNSSNEKGIHMPIQ
jgi:uncharacterized membrane protein